MSVKIDLAFIKKRRLELGMTTTEMAKALNLAGHDQYSRRENGIYKFKATELPALCKKLEIPVEKIFAKNSVKKAHQGV